MSRLIDEIKLPNALKDLSTSQLERVAKEVREEIINVTSKNGGHVASSLGTVDLTVAMHAAFESPEDKLLWDVGHQAYAHKILTGRLSNFNTLRQRQGLSGFPNINESDHDHFTVGHASTSISQALGMVKARDILKKDYSVIAVIGDASISGGLAFEALNNVSGLESNMIVVLNDNEMSISKNVGALSNYLTMVRTSDLYVDLRNRIERVIKHIPRIGVPLFEAARKLKDRTKHMVVDFKVDVIFEEFGFKYFGPIDGHNIPLLMSTFHHASEIEGPVLIHVITKKGKGYGPAEEYPTRFHGRSPFNKDTGKLINGNGGATYTKVFGKTMSKLADRDNKVVAVTAAMVDGTGLDDFAKIFPDRFFDVGIAEEHAVTFSGALASQGLKPVVAIYSTFLQRAFDEIIHDVCLQDQPVVFALDRGGIVGEDGATHNGIFDMAYLRTIPNMTIMAPKDENEFQHMLYTALNHDGPIAVRYPRGKGPGIELDKEFKKIEIGAGEVVKRSGSTLIIAIGSMVAEAEKCDATVINARFVKPLDKKLILEEAKKAVKIITVEEGTLSGGFGSAVVELLEDNGIQKPVKRLGLPDEFIEHGTRKEMLEKFALTGEGICSQISK